jgi:hypothetical protein
VLVAEDKTFDFISQNFQVVKPGLGINISIPN